MKAQVKECGTVRKWMLVGVVAWLAVAGGQGALAQTGAGSWAELLEQAEDEADAVDANASGERVVRRSERSGRRIETGGSQAEVRAITDLVDRISDTLASSAMSEPEKREAIRVMQRSTPEELFTSAVRSMPVFADGEIQTFDSVVRQHVSAKGDAPIMQDPVGAGMSILFNPTTENIADQVGADDRVREMVESLNLNPFDE